MQPYPAAVIEGHIQPAKDDFVGCARGAVACESACEYRPRRPEEGILYGVVAAISKPFWPVNGSAPAWSRGLWNGNCARFSIAASRPGKRVSKSHFQPQDSAVKYPPIKSRTFK
jgi:hypothetical protein